MQPSLESRSKWITCILKPYVAENICFHSSLQCLGNYKKEKLFLKNRVGAWFLCLEKFDCVLLSVDSSVSEFADLHRCLDSAMQRLVAIWDQIGIESDQRKAREAVVLRHVNDLLNDMVGEEDQLRQRLLDNIQKFSIQLFGVTQELHLPVYEVVVGCFVIGKQ